MAMLKKAEPNEAVLRLKAFEAFEKAADGNATKLIIPADLQNMVGLVSALRETKTPDASVKVKPRPSIESRPSVER